MKQIVPDYYDQFSCIGGSCSHNCCIGWEIDIDADSALRYAKLPGTLGEKLRNTIVTDTCTHFVLGEDERCPFLDQNNLCQLISRLGEESLCQICRDHPRFYNEWSDRTEVGLGLCCPTAAELILTRKNPVTLLVAEDDGAAEAPPSTDTRLLALRDRLIAKMQNRDVPVEERLLSLRNTVGSAPETFAPRRWEVVYRPLERMDSAWDTQLDRLRHRDIYLRTAYDAAFEIAREQLAVYLIYRHLYGALEDGRIAPRVAFAAHVVELLSLLAEDAAQLIDLARLYSAEIEYSEENLAAVLDALE